jgi:peptidoglycan/xylan/chitin deacetylase (PgdA/CDA1 family)
MVIMIPMIYTNKIMKILMILKICVLFSHMKKRIPKLLLCILLTAHHLTFAQSPAVWNGKKCAVVLTYDDALSVHLTNVVPVLDSLGLKATFYLSGYFPGFVNNINRWKAVSAAGHELANHTLFHPCAGDRPGREWVNPVYDLSKYSV